MPSWHFRRMLPGEMNVDPIEAEFFSTEALDSLADALVREAVQNSLDARLPGTQVRVRIAFPVATLRSDMAEGWLKGLPSHLEASRSGVVRPPPLGTPLDYLVIEDFGTRGLQGDPTQTEDDAIDDSAIRNDFYYFWRNIGRSRKSASDLGRWGLGKTVFPAASRINAFIALTRRADDGRRLLMGQSVLRIHKVGGYRHAPYGYFAAREGDFALPLVDDKLIADFQRDFDIQREAESGLSVVILFPDGELTATTILPSIVRHYFVPVVTGDLVVDVDTAGERLRIDAHSLPGMLEDAIWPDGARLARLVALASWAHSQPTTAKVRLAPPPETSAPRWEANCIDAENADLRTRFAAGKRLAFSVPVWVKPIGHSNVLSHFDVYLERDDDLGKAEEHFVRDGITIAGVRGGAARGIRALVVVRDRPLAALLGDSENPAHTEWQERSPKFRDCYTHGPSTLRYVRNAPAKLATTLTRPAAGRDETLLRHVFSLDLPTEAALTQPNATETPSPGRGDTTTVNFEAVEVGRERLFRLQRMAGGFQVSGQGDKPTPPFVVVRVAYEVRRGNPFTQYQPPDFDLARPPIRIETKFATVMRRAGNALIARIEDPTFRLKVRGFDPNRDIRVRIDAAPDKVGL